MYRAHNWMADGCDNAEDFMAYDNDLTAVNISGGAYVAISNGDSEVDGVSVTLEPGEAKRLGIWLLKEFG